MARRTPKEIMQKWKQDLESIEFVTVDMFPNHEINRYGEIRTKRHKRYLKLQTREKESFYIVGDVDGTRHKLTREDLIEMAFPN